jgi:DNA sulfur modification protein DndE
MRKLLALKHGLLLIVLLPFLSWMAPAPRIFLVGDSTMADNFSPDKPGHGWGQYCGQFFDLTVKNYAVNGRSTKSYINEHRWDSVLAQLQPGDWVLIQFGHNDEKKEDTSRYAAPNGAYKDNLLRFVREARNKGANPILITPVSRRKFNDKGVLEDTHGDYPAAVKAVAAAQHVPLIDLGKSSSALLTQLGVQGSEKLFATTPPGHYTSVMPGLTDNTHFSPYGATRVASLVAQEIAQQHLGLEKYLSLTPFNHKYRFELPEILEPHFKLDTFNIVAFGAKSDGATLNTKAINTAIDDCSRNGGGVVLLPAGIWLSGPVVLKSNVNLHLARNAILQFTTDFDQYPLIATTYEGLNAIRCQSPISAVHAENVAITGKGIIDGGGDAWRMVKKDKLNETQWAKLVASGGILDADGRTWYPSVKSQKGSNTPQAGVMAPGKSISDYNDIKDFLRPNLLSISDCKYVLLEGVTFQNSPAWCLHPLLCEHITLRGLTAKNPWYAQNGDGVDLESCRYGRVEGCTFDVGDDGICIKSGRDEEGRKRGVPTENIIVHNCTVYHAHGGFVIGSEMSGGARNLYVSDCSFLGTDIGLRFKTTRGRGGIVEKIYVSNINMKDIPEEAILFDMYYMAKDPLEDKGAAPKVSVVPVTEATPQFRDFYISHVLCYGAATAIFIRGLPEMHISHITLDDITIRADKAGALIEASDIAMHNVNLITHDGSQLTSK